MKILWWVSLVFVITNVGALAEEPQLNSPRVVFQTNYGDIEFGFYPSVAPKTVYHIFELVRLGCYNTNHFFRVDRGFVAQVADVASGRSAPMNEEQRKEAEKTIVGEFSDVKHVRGILSMGRYSDPDSAQSSFSILLGDAPHLDGQYAIFGKVTKGDETLRKLEELPTRREGIFVMPVERVTIFSSYYYGLNSIHTFLWHEFLNAKFYESYLINRAPLSGVTKYCAIAANEMLPLNIKTASGSAKEMVKTLLLCMKSETGLQV
ncbi:hypothetical protein V6Z11_A03G121300 [Gossypium hirsutum]